MAIEFTKLHGLGNDYLFIDCMEREVDDPAGLSRVMSHRHLGVGADGIILILPGEDGAEFRMRMFNADGSEAETCGNGIRCFAKYVFERGMTDNTEFVIGTLAGPNAVVLNADNGVVASVRSNMGEPRFDRAEIPMAGPPGRVIEEPLDLPGESLIGKRLRFPSSDRHASGRAERLEVTCVNIGNPHAVIFVEDAAAAPVSEVGPKVENHPAFPQRTNVEFVSIVDRENIVMRIWERGSGITMASGSGSCGAALASMITDRVDRRVNVHLVYGALTIEWAEDGSVYQEGPATEVFSGVWT